MNFSHIFTNSPKKFRNRTFTFRAWNFFRAYTPSQLYIFRKDFLTFEALEILGAKIKISSPHILYTVPSDVWCCKPHSSIMKTVVAVVFFVNEKLQDFEKAIKSPKIT